MYRCLIGLLFIVSAAASAAPAWTWIDANGQRHFSDRPVPGATQINLPDSTPRPAAAVTATAPGAGAAPEPALSAPPQTAGSYTRFDILSPSNEQTLWNIGAMLSMQVAIEPALQPNHVIDVILDGQRVELDSRSTQLTVPDVFRGLHTIQAVIVDAASGREVLRSLAISFVVQQTSLLNPNNPNH